ncbi:MAG: FliA/WhiG family RNA polymerase sigma factor [Acidobacteria bacterium]|nr:FliA/WhiG family RNA polymerase sigma factor [Acidobacteriota bacterium]
MKKATRTGQPPHRRLSSAQVQQARRDGAVVEHLPLVHAIALRLHETLPIQVDLADLVQAGTLGLFDAVTKYRPEKQVAFRSYAQHRIKGAMLDSLRELDWASRDLRRRHRRIEAVARQLATILNRYPTDAEIAERMGMCVERWQHMMADIRQVALISASETRGGQDDLPARELPARPETRPDAICARSQLRTLLNGALRTLSPRYRQMIALYYLKHLTMREIASVLGVNESRVSQIHKAALEKLSASLGAAGIRSSRAF